MNLKLIPYGAAIAAAMIAVSSPAQALNLAGQNLSLVGNTSISQQPGNFFDLSFKDVVIASQSDAPPFTIGDSVNISGLSNLSEGGNPFGSIPNFISGIELTSGEEVSFDLLNLLFDVDTANLGGTTTFLRLVFDGNFVSADGTVLGFGAISTQVAGSFPVGQSVDRPFSADIATVPTPALAPAALGFVAALLRKRKGEKVEQEAIAKI